MMTGGGRSRTTSARWACGPQLQANYLLHPEKKLWSSGATWSTRGSPRATSSSTLDDFIKALVGDDDAATILVIMEAKLSKCGTKKKVEAMQELGRIHLSECLSIAAYFARISKAIWVLNSENSSVSEEIVICYILSGLTEEYLVIESMITQKEGLTVDKVQNILNKHSFSLQETATRQEAVLSPWATFVMRRGLYKPTVMPFGLTNMPAMFQ